MSETSDLEHYIGIEELCYVTYVVVQLLVVSCSYCSPDTG